jgi:lauroyl/myristoyl acyltransferase
MRLQDVTSSKRVTQLGLFIGQHMPRRVGYGLARFVASIIARRKPEVYWTVRANLRQVVGPEADDGTLHEMAHQVFFHAGQTYYDFFDAVGQPPEVLVEAVQNSGAIAKQIMSEMTAGQGVLLLGVHMSNFDMVGLALGAHGFPSLVLSAADPQTGFRVLNHLRREAGFEVMPITSQSLRVAIRRLKSGGLVLTGLDRPIPQDRELVEFLGRPAYLPVGPVRIALMTGATVFVGCCHYDRDEGYVLEATGPIEMVRTGDRRQDILTNTRRLAVVLEGYVRAHPEQWMMFHPFWPESPAVRPLPP